jgi:hypothetical protein
MPHEDRHGSKEILVTVFCGVVFAPMGAYIAVEKLGLPGWLGLFVGLALACGAYALRRFRVGGGVRSCSTCTERLPAASRWEDQLTFEQRLRLESYEDVEYVFQCRACGERSCQLCAFETHFQCRSCDAGGLRKGYVVPRKWLRASGVK